MCFINESSLSSNTPRSQTTVAGSMMLFPTHRLRSKLSIFSKLCCAKPNNFGLWWIQLKSSGWTPFVNGLDALLQSLDGVCDVVDVCVCFISWVSSAYRCWPSWQLISVCFFGIPSEDDENQIDNKINVLQHGKMYISPQNPVQVCQFGAGIPKCSVWTDIVYTCSYPPEQ